MEALLRSYRLAGPTAPIHTAAWCKPATAVFGVETYGGGTNGGYGTVFQATTNGALSSLVSFNGSNGANPCAGLALGNDGNFYGTTVANSDKGTATLFKMTTNGVLSTVLEFIGDWTYFGRTPRGAIVQGTDGNFYITSSDGGVNFATGGTVLSVSGGKGTLLVAFNNADGAMPYAGLIQASDGNFYGTTAAGGANGGGTVFKLSSYPLVTSQTTNQTAQCGSNAAFSVSAVAMMTPFTYQW